MNDLTTSTAALYEAFHRYPLKPRIEGCPHCKLESAEASLHSRPLRDLSWGDFGVYPFKAMTTFGDESDFKHFLPRILELCLLDYEGALWDVAVILGKLDYAGWASWPEPEIQAVRRFVGAWRQALAARVHESTEEAWQLEELESALAQLGFNGRIPPNKPLKLSAAELRPCERP